MAENPKTDLILSATREGLAARLDLLSRAGAIFLVMVAGAGFLTVSIHDASYGIVQFNLFRARLVSAGILFMIFLAIPFFTASRIYGLFGFEARTPIKPDEEQKKATLFLYYLRSVRMLDFLIAAVALTFFMRILLEHYEINLRLGGFFTGFSALAIWISLLIQRHFHKRPAKCALLAVFTIAVGFGGGAFFADPSFFLLFIWLFLAGSVALYVHKPVQEPKELRNLNWHLWLLNALALVSFFAVSIYPRIRPVLGGGAPIRVTFQFADKSPIDKAERMRALLIDETDSGFYIARSPEDKKAVFLPRQVISALYYSQGSDEDRNASPPDSLPTNGGNKAPTSPKSSGSASPRP